MLRKLLPAFFFLALIFSDFAFSVPVPYRVVNPYVSPVTSFASSVLPYHYQYALAGGEIALGGYDHPGCWLITDYALDPSGRVYALRIYGCKTRGDAHKLCSAFQAHVSKYYGVAPPFVSCSDIYPNVGELSAGDFSVLSRYWNSPPLPVDFTGKVYLVDFGAFLPDGLSVLHFYIYTQNVSMGLTSLSYDFGNGMQVCIDECKADLAAAKTAIQTEGNSLIANLAGSGAAAAPCIQPYFCFTGQEAFFQPIVNGVLLLGTVMSSAIVFRKKKPQGRDRRK